MVESAGWRMWDVREMVEQIETGVKRGARRCRIQSVEHSCVEEFRSRVRGEIMRDMRELMRETNHWSGRELPRLGTAEGERKDDGTLCLTRYLPHHRVPLSTHSVLT